MKSLRRRLLGSGCALLAAATTGPTLVLAQARAARIGFLAARKPSVITGPILRRLAELGYVEGKNLLVEYRSTEGAVDRFPSLARELIEAKCDVIFASGLHAAQALFALKSTVPVVIVAIDYDPVRAGVVSSVRRPGGNLTGVALRVADLLAKRVEILREVLPGARRVLLFTDPFTVDLIEDVEQAAKRAQLEIKSVPFLRRPYEFAPAFEQGRAAGVEALLLPTSPVFFDQRATIYRLGMNHRLPVMVGSSAWWTGEGWFLGYGAMVEKSYARAAEIAAEILKGKPPGEMPIEHPQWFELAINLRTAKALGITIPRSVLLRADKVIE